MLKHLSAVLLMSTLVACASNQTKPDSAAEEMEDAQEEMAEAEVAMEDAKEEMDDAHGEMAEADAAIDAAEAKMGVQTEHGMLYGAAFERGTPVAIAAVVASPAQYKDAPIVVEGQIRQVCQAMGCWFELATGAEADMGVRVTSKEHNVFIPKDSAGKMATIMGTLEVREVSEDEAEHYRSEGAEAKAGQELTLYMTGVALK